MDSNRQARQKGFVRGLIAASLLTVSAIGASGQQPARRPTSQPAPSPQSGPANDLQRLLASGQAAQDQGRYEDAISTYNRVIALSGAAPKIAALANFRIGNVLMAQGKFDMAANMFQRAITLVPDYADAYNNFGEALGELKQFTKAIDAFNRAVALDPKLLKARYNIAVSYDRLGNFKYSEFVFRTLIKNSPDYGLAYDGLAVTLSKSGRAKDAIALHEKAISLNPKDPSYYYNLAISYLILGNTPKAMEQEQKLKAIDSGVADRLASVIVKRQMK
jgi:tetratricopeptide (TPR) repeat protein